MNFDSCYNSQKMKFSIKNLLSKYDQIRSSLQICSHLLKKSLMEKFIFCAVLLLVHENSPTSITTVRGGSGTAATSKMEHFVIIVSVAVADFEKVNSD